MLTRQVDDIVREPERDLVDGEIGVGDMLRIDDLQRYEKSVAATRFQVWKLTVHSDRTASLVCDNGNDNLPPIRAQRS